MMVLTFRLFYASILLYYHWEAMLISYLATRVIVLPFNGIKELVDKSSFLIALNPGSSYEDAFKYANEPDWQAAWTSRIEPYLEDYKDGSSRMIQYPLEDSNIALYDTFFAAQFFYSLSELFHSSDLSRFLRSHQQQRQHKCCSKKTTYLLEKSVDQLFARNLFQD